MTHNETQTISVKATGGRYPGLLAPPFYPEDVTLQIHIRNGRVYLRFDSVRDWEFWLEADFSAAELMFLVEQPDQ